MDIDFLKQNQTQSPPPHTGPSFRGFFVLLVLTISMLTLVGMLTVFHRTNGVPLFVQLKGLLRSADIALQGEKDDRINVLLLGVGGDGHDGGYLTDTIVLASLVPSTGASSLISIPR
ncbi:MAG: Cell envelope-related transcriptional attenuator, partial [Candidatus Giovannonibacteria bacterium GW2011_GWA2_53_7]